MSKKRVLICGASGFIGYNIFETLSKRQDLEVYGTCLNNCYRRLTSMTRILRADLTNLQEVKNILSLGFDLIIQAAAATSGVKDTIERPYIQVTDNAVMNPLIFESAYLYHVPQVISFSTSIVYPPHANRPLTETDVDLNTGFAPKYFGAGWMKIGIEKLCQFYAGLGRTKYTVIRPANVYGPNDRFDLEKSHVLAAIITKVLMAKDGKIILWGSGQERKDLLFISDLVNFVELAMEKQKDPFELFNAGSGELISIRDLARKVIAISGQPLTIIYDFQAPTISTSILLNSAKAQEELGWRQQVNLDEGLQKTIAWFKQNEMRKKHGH